MILAICDDIEKDRITIKSMINRYLDEHRLYAKIYCFSSGEEFLQHADIKFDAVFMDIFMDKINGIDAAIQYSRNECRFIFITTSPDHSLDAFSVNAAHYLLKPVTYEGIREAMCRCFPEPNVKSYIYIKQKKLTIPVLQSSIMYIDVLDNTLTLHTLDGNIRTRMTLTSVYKMLDRSEFLRPQRSFIVNMSFIDSISTNSLILTDGTEISISRDRKSDVASAYETYLFRKIRKGNGV